MRLLKFFREDGFINADHHSSQGDNSQSATSESNRHGENRASPSFGGSAEVQSTGVSEASERRPSIFASNVMLRNGIAGSLAGMACQATFHPLDSLKTRLQASQKGTKLAPISLSYSIKEAKRIFDVEGIGSFYAGIRPAVIASGLSWGLYFAMYNTAKEYLGVNSQDSIYSGSSYTLRLMLSGVLAGTFTSSFTHPLWFLKTLMQLQKRENFPPEKRYRSMSHAFRTIVATDGIQGLFVGIIPTLALVSHGVIHFVCYDLLKSKYISLFEDNKELLSHEAFVCGGLTKTVAVGSTYPLQVVKTRLQDYENRADGNLRYRGMIDCFKKIYIQEGIWSFYRGIWPVVIRLAPQGAVTFMIYEQVQKLLKQL